MRKERERPAPVGPSGKNLGAGRPDSLCKRRLERELAKLETQQGRHFKQLEFDFSSALGQVKADRKRRQEAATADLFAQYQDWIRQTLELDDRAQFTVVAALVA